MAGTLEYGDKPSDSKNAGNFLNSCRTSSVQEAELTMILPEKNFWIPMFCKLFEYHSDSG